MTTSIEMFPIYAASLIIENGELSNGEPEIAGVGGGL